MQSTRRNLADPVDAPPALGYAVSWEVDLLNADVYLKASQRSSRRVQTEGLAFAVGRDHDPANAQTTSCMRRKSHGHNLYECEIQGGAAVAARPKYDKRHFTSAYVEAAARCSFHHVETYL